MGVEADCTPGSVGGAARELIEGDGSGSESTGGAGGISTRAALAPVFAVVDDVDGVGSGLVWAALRAARDIGWLSLIVVFLGFGFSVARASAVLLGAGAILSDVDGAAGGGAGCERAARVTSND